MAAWSSAALLIAALAAPFGVAAQNPPFATPLPMCYAPPSPGTDGWPVAVADDLGSTPAAPVTFSRAALLFNDIGTALVISGVDAVSSQGGHITGTDPLTYTPPNPFLGVDSFSYEITDGSGRTAIGVVRVTSGPDTIDPSVSITAPIGGNVAGSVMLTASASDNVGVTRVVFFDADSQIGGGILAPPYQTVWDTTQVGDGNHALTAVAFDAVGNIGVSAPVSVNVVNHGMVGVPSLVGLTQAAAQSKLTSALLTLGTVSSANSSTFAAGLVIDQLPAAGTAAAPNSAVAVTISLGPAMVAVPDVRGRTQAAAQTAITGATLAVGSVTTATSSTVAAGLVISQSPANGTLVLPGTGVSFVVSVGLPPIPSVDKMVFSDGAGKRTTAAFSTIAAGETLVAFAASDGPATANGQTLTIAGAGLTWTRVRRAATQFGDAEIWTATAPTVLTNVTVSSTQSWAGVHQSLTVIAFTGVAGVGASNIGGGVSSGASTSVVATAAGSVVYAVGNDWDHATARTVPSGQTKVHEFVDTLVGDTYWVEAAKGTTAATGSTVTLNASDGTNDHWNMAIVELTPSTPVVNITVPNVAGMTQAAAQTAITAAGLAVGAISTAASETAPLGSVITESPAAGASLPTGAAVALVVSTGPAVPTPVATVFSDGTGARTTPAFSTSGATVLIALAASDGPPTGANTQMLTVSGAGLTWTRVAQAADSRGVSEIWTANAAGALNNVTVTSTQAVTVLAGKPVSQSLTVIAFTGASGVGASSFGSSADGAPTASLLTTSDWSVVYGVGNDFDAAVARTVAPDQTKVHEYFTASTDTLWVQKASAAVPIAGTFVTLSDTAPTTDQWNFAIVEIKR